MVISCTDAVDFTYKCWILVTVGASFVVFSYRRFTGLLFGVGESGLDGFVDRDVEAVEGFVVEF
jgi:hypothetical protein